MSAPLRFFPSKVNALRTMGDSVSFSFCGTPFSLHHGLLFTGVVGLPIKISCTSHTAELGLSSDEVAPQLRASRMWLPCRQKASRIRQRYLFLRQTQLSFLSKGNENQESVFSGRFYISILFPQESAEQGINPSIISIHK